MVDPLVVAKVEMMADWLVGHLVDPLVVAKVGMMDDLSAAWMVALSAYLMVDSMDASMVVELVVWKDVMKVVV